MQQDRKNAPNSECAKSATDTEHLIASADNTVKQNSPLRVDRQHVNTTFQLHYGKNMKEIENKISEFVEYASKLHGDEKGEAQVFCDRLFKAFGHQGYFEAGARLEERVKIGNRTKFADLFWKDILLIEMKKRGENLNRHYRQAFEYWVNLVPHRPRYVVLCNFEKFIIYDFNLQVDEPVDVVEMHELVNRYTALNFLLPGNKSPIFKNNLVEVTKGAAANIAQIYNMLVKRGENEKSAQRFMLQCVFCMFSEDVGLLPKSFFSELLNDCKNGKSTYDLLGGLFRQMNSPARAKAGIYKDIRYFNGGLFNNSDPIELNSDELSMLQHASSQDWSKVKPPIFGTLFQSSMNKDEQHAYGAHFTSEADIQKVILPTIVRPWRELISSTKTLKGLYRLRLALSKFTVLDPACGSGNFLYVAYQELKRLELELYEKIYEGFGVKAIKKIGAVSGIKTSQFFGIDAIEFAAELAKTTLTLAKELSFSDLETKYQQLGLPELLDKPLPLDNLDSNILCGDALFTPWPKTTCIIGNPPFQSKNKMVEELGRGYVDRLRKEYSRIPGRADYCVYWFRKAHEHLSDGQRAGLVGTNTVRQNYSRQGGLDYIVNNGGTITEAISSQVWSGDAVVHVSIVNWIKGEAPGKKKLFYQKGDKAESPWEAHTLDFINSSLSNQVDVSSAFSIMANKIPKRFFQGQTHGHEGFLINEKQYKRLSSSSKKFVNPYLIGDDLLGCPSRKPSRYCIDVSDIDDISELSAHKDIYQHLLSTVQENMKEKADKERLETSKNTGPRQSHYAKWWKLWRSRPELKDNITTMKRYIACVRVTRRPIFEFISTKIMPNDSLQVFALDDYYSFGVLQSTIHWTWFVERCSTLKADFRYTSDTVFDSFPWPQSPSPKQVIDIANAAESLREYRNYLLNKHGFTLRHIYKTLEVAGKNKLRTLTASLDKAVLSAYGFDNKDYLTALLNLNRIIKKHEEDGTPVNGPGLPFGIKDKSKYISDSCVF